VFRFLAVLGSLLIVCGTSHDILARKRHLKPSKVANIFSAWKNFDELLVINESSSVIKCINAMKVISALWIVCGHRQEKLKIQKTDFFLEKFVLTAVEPFTNAVVTFIVCSAVVVTQSLMKSFDR
jgi:hypothetical protein